MLCLERRRRQCPAWDLESQTRQMPQTRQSSCGRAFPAGTEKAQPECEGPYPTARRRSERVTVLRWSRGRADLGTAAKSAVASRRASRVPSRMRPTRFARRSCACSSSLAFGGIVIPPSPRLRPQRIRSSAGRTAVDRRQLRSDRLSVKAAPAPAATLQAEDARTPTHASEPILPKTGNQKANPDARSMSVAVDDLCKFCRESRQPGCHRLISVVGRRQ